MFERYTEKARRVIFFARYEASAEGSHYIEDRHLLLGLMREAREIFEGVAGGTALEEIRKRISDAFPAGERIATSVDLPLSVGSRQILAYAAEESERLQHRHVGTQHLLLGLLRENEGLPAQILRERGLTLEDAREQMAIETSEGEPARPGRTGFAGRAPDVPEYRTISRLLAKIPRDRLGFAAQVLQALAWDTVSVSGSGTGGEFSFKLEKS